MKKYIPKLSTIQKSDQRFILRMILAFSSFLIVTVILQLVSYYVQKTQIERERDIAVVVSASANQKTLSQRIALLSMALINVESDLTREKTKNALLSEISNIEVTHQALIAGDPVTGIDGDKSPQIRNIFFGPETALDRKTRDFILTAKDLTNSDISELNFKNPKLFKLAEMSTELLALFEKLTMQYQHEGVDRILGLKTLARRILFAELGLVLLAIIFIFNPIINRLKVELYERGIFQSELVEQNRELEQFSATVAHDLKAPLNNIGGFSQFLRSKLANKEDKESNDILDSIETGVRRMTQMINELLHYAKVTRRDRKLEKVSLEQVVNKVKKDFEKKIEDEKAELKIKNLPSIIGNRVQLEHLFMNLVSNALKFRHPERSPVILIQPTENVQNDTDIVTIVIEDNGRGFPVGAEDRMFEPFRRITRDDSVEGSGFGLALCMKVAKRHNGNIFAEHVESGGTRFVLTLSKG